MFVVLTDACPKGDHLLVPICSVRDKGHDPSCVFEVSEHAVIVNKSYLLYARVQKHYGKNLLDKVQALEIIPSGQLSAVLLKRAQDGMKKSPHPELWAKKYFQQQVP